MDMKRIYEISAHLTESRPVILMKQLTTMLLILMSVGLAGCAKDSCTEKKKPKQERSITDNKHLTFKGVPIDGPLNEYVTKMEAAGFSYLGTLDGTAILHGDFAGFKRCTIAVLTLKNSDIVNTIEVSFPEKDDWSSLEENYQLLKKMLTEKYGKPSETVEEFHGYSHPNENFMKLHDLQMDRCTYKTVFNTAKGDIEFSLAHKDVTSCFVKLRYWDKINTEAVRAKAMDDL